MKIKTYATCAVIAVCLILTACESPFANHPYRDWIERDPEVWRLSNGGPAHAGHTLKVDQADAPGSTLPDNATVDDFVALAMRRSPAIRRAQLKIDRLQARIPQQTSLDDPQFMLTPIGEMAETAEGRVAVMTTLSQKFPWPGKLNTKGRIAMQQVAMAQQELAQTRLRIADDVRQAYWNYYFAVRGGEVLQQQRGLLGQFKEVAEAKYRAGSVSQQDVIRASVELSDLDNELLTLQQRRTSAVAMLNRLLDRPTRATIAAPPKVELREAWMALDNLLARAAIDNPRLESVRRKIAMYREQYRLAKLDRYPDMTVSVGYNVVEDEGHAAGATGQDQWQLGVGFNIPLWQQKREAAEREALSGIFESIAELTDMSNEVSFRVQDALIRVQTQQQLVTMFRDVIIPQAQQAVDASHSSYRAGKTDFLTLIDNWRKLLDFQLLYHKSLSQFEQDFADLQREVGQRLPRVARKDSVSNLEEAEDVR